MPPYHQDEMLELLQNLDQTQDHLFAEYRRVNISPADRFRKHSTQRDEALVRERAAHAAEISALETQPRPNWERECIAHMWNVLNDPTQILSMFDSKLDDDVQNTADAPIIRILAHVFKIDIEIGDYWYLHSPSWKDVQDRYVVMSYRNGMPVAEVKTSGGGGGDGAGDGGGGSGDEETNTEDDDDDDDDDAAKDALYGGGGGGDGVHNIPEKVWPTAQEQVAQMKAALRDETERREIERLAQEAGGAQQEEGDEDDAANDNPDHTTANELEGDEDDAANDNPDHTTANELYRLCGLDQLQITKVRKWPTEIQKKFDRVIASTEIESENTRIGAQQRELVRNEARNNLIVHKRKTEVERLQGNKTHLKQELKDLKNGLNKELKAKQMPEAWPNKQRRKIGGIENQIKELAARQTSCRQQTAPPPPRCSKDVTAHPHRPGARPGRPCQVPARSGQPLSGRRLETFRTTGCTS
jgi:hypothetical protein